MHTQQEHEICIPLKAQSKWSRTPPCLKLFSSWSLDYSDTCWSLFTWPKIYNRDMCFACISMEACKMEMGRETLCTINRVAVSESIEVENKQTEPNHLLKFTDGTRMHISIWSGTAVEIVCRQEIVMSVCEIIRLLKVLHQDWMCVGYLSAHILPRRSSSFRIGRSSSLVPIQKYWSGSATSGGRWL